MKKQVESKETLIIGSGPAEIRVAIQRSEMVDTDHVDSTKLRRQKRLVKDLIFMDANGERIGQVTYETLRRVCAAYEDHEGLWRGQHDVCADHGFYEARKGEYKCSKCQDEEAAQAASEAQPLHQEGADDVPF